MIQSHRNMCFWCLFFYYKPRHIPFKYRGPIHKESQYKTHKDTHVLGLPMFPTHCHGLHISDPNKKLTSGELVLVINR